MTTVYWNGRFLEASLVAIDVSDGGLLYGDGLFETLRVELGRALEVERHLARLERGLQRLQLQLPESVGSLAGPIERVASSAPRPIARLRVTITRGSVGGAPTRLITALPYVSPQPEAYVEGVDVVVANDWRTCSRGPLVGLKSTSYQAYIIASSAARAAGAFDALLVNEKERLVEGTRSSLVVQLDNRMVTPPESDGCLAGTVRGRLVEAGAVAEAPVPLSSLSRVQAAFLANSLIGVLPVARVDGRLLPEAGSGARGDAAKLAARLRDHLMGDWSL